MTIHLLLLIIQVTQIRAANCTSGNVMSSSGIATSYTIYPYSTSVTINAFCDSYSSTTCSGANPTCGSRTCSATLSSPTGQATPYVTWNQSTQQFTLATLGASNVAGTYTVYLNCQLTNYPAIKTNPSVSVVVKDCSSTSGNTMALPTPLPTITITQNYIATSIAAFCDSSSSTTCPGLSPICGTRSCTVTPTNPTTPQSYITWNQSTQVFSVVSLGASNVAGTYIVSLMCQLSNPYQTVTATTSLTFKVITCASGNTMIAPTLNAITINQSFTASTISAFSDVNSGTLSPPTCLLRDCSVVSTPSSAYVVWNQANQNFQVNGCVGSTDQFGSPNLSVALTCKLSSYTTVPQVASTLVLTVTRDCLCGYTPQAPPSLPAITIDSSYTPTTIPAFLVAKNGNGSTGSCGLYTCTSDSLYVTWQQTSQNWQVHSQGVSVDVPGNYNVNLSCTLQSWPTIPAATKTFQLTVTTCQLTSMVGGGVISGGIINYKIYSASIAQINPVSVTSQSPNCGYSSFNIQVQNTVAVPATSAFITTTSSTLVINTSNNLLAGIHNLQWWATPTQNLQQSPLLTPFVVNMYDCTIWSSPTTADTDGLTSCYLCPSDFLTFTQFLPPSASGSNCGPVTYSIVGGTPLYLTLDPTLFRITLLPTANNQGGTFNLQLQAFNSAGNLYSTPLAFTVQINPCSPGFTNLSVTDFGVYNKNVFDPATVIPAVTWTQTPNCGYPPVDTLLTKQLSTPADASPSSALPFWSSSGSSLNLVSSDTTLNGKEYTFIQQTTFATTPATVFTVSGTVTWYDPCINAYYEDLLADPVTSYGPGASSPITIPGPATFQTQTFTNYLATSALSPTPVTSTFSQYTDSVGVAYNIPLICGPRTYTLDLYSSGTYSTYTGTFLTLNVGVPSFSIVLKSLLVSDFITPVVNNSYGPYNYLVRLTASLTNYPTVLKRKLLYIYISECQITTMTPSGTFTLPLFQKVFSPATTYPTLTYTQTPACNFVVTYSVLAEQQLPVTAVAYTAETFAQITGSNVVVYSNDYTLDLQTYRIKYLATFTGSTLSYNSAQTADLQWKDPCKTTTFVLGSSFFIGDNFGFIQTPAVAYKIDMPWLNDATNVLYGTSTPQNNSICQSQTYSITDETGNSPTYVTQQLNSASNVTTLFFQSYDPVMSLSPHRITVTYGLAQYNASVPVPTASISFNYTFYYINPPTPPLDQTYQALMAKINFTIPLFTLRPANASCLMTYNLLVNGAVAPLWIQYSVVGTGYFFTVQSFDIGMVGQNVVEFEAIATLAPQPKAQSSIRFNVNVTSPPDFSLLGPITAPEFTSPIGGPFSFVQGDGWEPPYTLPSSVDSVGLAVNIDVDNGLARDFVNYEKVLQTFSLKKTSPDDVGTYKITVTLSNYMRASRVYTFELEIKARPGAKTKINVDQNATAKAFKTAKVEPKVVQLTAEQMMTPQVQFISMSADGLVKLSFSKVMNPIPLAQINNATDSKKKVRLLSKAATYTNATILKVAVSPGRTSSPLNLTFTYNVTKFTEQEMDIQMYFKTAMLVSYRGSSPDTLSITFDGSQVFVDMYNISLPQNTTITQIIPSQIQFGSKAGKTMKLMSNFASGASNAVMGTNLALNIILSASLQMLWSMVNTQQLVVLMPLWNVNLPANAVLFYGFIMQIASFDILPTDLFWNYCFPGINPDGLNAVNPNFASVGYYSYYLIYNFGSMMITYVAFPFLAIIVAIMQPFVGRNKKVAYVHKKIKESIMWGGTITTITESYTVGLTCICVNTLYYTWGTAGEILSSILTPLFGLINLVFPPIMTWFVYKNWYKTEEPQFKQYYGAFYEAYDTDKGKGILFASSLFYFRRLLVVVTVCYQNNIVVQMYAMTYTVIAQMIIICEVKPFAGGVRPNIMELFNESIILLVMYTMICFTDFVPSKDAQEIIGYVSAFFVCAHLLINLTIMLTGSVKQMILKVKRCIIMKEVNKKNKEKKMAEQAEKKKRKEYRKARKLIVHVEQNGNDAADKPQLREEQKEEQKQDPYSIRRMENEFAEMRLVRNNAEDQKSKVQGQSDNAGRLEQPIPASMVEGMFKDLFFNRNQVQNQNPSPLRARVTAQIMNDDADVDNQSPTLPPFRLALEQHVPVLDFEKRKGRTWLQRRIEVQRNGGLDW